MPEAVQHFESRQEMRRQTFEIFHYLDRHAGPVALHHHDFYEMYFFLRGSVDYLVEGQTHRLQPGDLLLISPLELHQPVVHPDSEAYERIVLWIDPVFLHDQSTARESLMRCFDISRPEHRNLLRLPTRARRQLHRVLRQLLEESRSPAYGQELLCQGLLLQLLVHLNRAVPQGPGLPRPAQGQSLTDRVVEYIGQNYALPLNLDSLAEHFFVSKYHLCHEFGRAMGVSVYRYLTLKRLVIAKQMLSGGVAPTNVYEACGFGDYANFYRAFKAEYGAGPSQFVGR